MKKSNIIALSLILTVLITSSAFVFALNSEKDYSDNVLDKKMLKKVAKMDIVDTDVNTTICREDAIKIVKDQFPLLSEQAKNIKAQKVMLTQPGCGPLSNESVSKNNSLKEKGYIDNIPVWIVVLKDGNYNMPSNGTGDNKKSADMQIIIDANSGEVLNAFFYGHNE